MAVAGYARTLLGPLQETVRVALSLTDNQMALLQGPAMAVPVVIASIPLGLVIDRYRRTPLLLGLVVLNLAGSVLTVFASGFASLVCARALAGVAAQGMVPVVFSLLADIFAPSLRGRATTIVIVGQVVGNSAAFALGGRLLASGNSAGEDWRWALLWLAVPIALAGATLLALREPPRTGVRIQKPSVAQLWGELWQYRQVIAPVAAGIILMETAVGAMLIWAAPMYSRNFGLGPDRIGVTMAVGMLCSGILGPITGGALADLCQRTGGPKRTATVLGALALVSAPASLFAFVRDFASVSVLLISAMTIMLAVAVMGMALFTVAIANELRGLCMSMLTGFSMLAAFAVAPLAVSLLSGAMGGTQRIGEALSTICVSASLLSALAFGLGARFLAPSTVE